MYDFFISYNNSDVEWAEWIAWHLEENGYKVVLQAWDFLPGTNFALAMHEASQTADKTIAVLSPAYLDSQFTMPEWSSAFTKDPTSRQGKLLPVKVKACDPGGILNPIVCIDLVGLSQDDAKSGLLQGVSQKRRKPSAEPRFPGVQPIILQPPLPTSKYGDHITILHLSDLQFGLANRIQLHDEFMSNVSRFIHGNRLMEGSASFVLISGDIAFSGNEYEYAYAEKIMFNFFEQIQVDPLTECFLSPGNHDVDWLSVGPIDNRIISGIKSEEELARIFNHPPTMELLSFRLKKFYNFSGRLLGRAREFRSDRPWRVDVQQCIGQRIATIQLNSAWAIGPGKPDPILGEYQIREALAEAEGATLRLWLIHHGLDFLNKDEKSRLFGLLRREHGIDIIYSGHTHSKSTLLQSPVLPNVFEFISGPLNPVGFNPGFSITKIQPEFNAVDFKLYTVDTTRRGLKVAKSEYSISQTGGTRYLATPPINKLAEHYTDFKRQIFHCEHNNIESDISGFTFTDISAERLARELVKNRVVLIVTDFSIELTEVLNLLTPLPEQDAILRVCKEQETYYVGEYGAESAVVMMLASSMGDVFYSVLSTQKAISMFNPIAIIMVGVACGLDRDKQKLGDVLVASKVIQFEEHIDGDKRNLFRGTIAQTGPTLLRMFRQALDWKFMDNNNGDIYVHFGPLLSCDKPISSTMAINSAPMVCRQAIGIDLSGAGIYAVAAQTATECIDVKAVSDFADGHKCDNAQIMAAQAAAALVHHVLSDSTGLAALK